MNKAMIAERARIEEVVEARKELAGIQGRNGTFALREELGAGVIRETGPQGEYLVHWVQADFDSWVLPDEIDRLDPAARVIAIYEQDGHEKRLFKRYKIVTRKGLDHSWAVELFPDNVVRTVRTDGWAWTFDWYPLFDRAYPIHTLEANLPSDDQAEALTAVELALCPE